MEKQDRTAGWVARQIRERGIAGLDMASLGIPLDPADIEAIAQRRREVQIGLRRRIDEWTVDGHGNG
jgi:hypothetical protein